MLALGMANGIKCINENLTHQSMDAVVFLITHSIGMIRL